MTGPEFEVEPNGENGESNGVNGVNGGGGGGGGGGHSDTPPPPPDVPTGQYRKTRSVDPFTADQTFTAGGTPRQPASESVPSPNINFTIDDDAFYRWTGLIPFDNAEFDFEITADGPIRVLLDGVSVINDFVDRPTRTLKDRRIVTAGNRLLTIEWITTGISELVFTVTKFSVADETPGIDLRDIIEITPSSDVPIERSYVLGSGNQVSGYSLGFFNKSNDLTVQVNLTGPRPVAFDINSFSMSPQETRIVEISFILSELDVLPEALIKSDVVVVLTAEDLAIDAGEMHFDVTHFDAPPIEHTDTPPAEHFDVPPAEHFDTPPPPPVPVLSVTFNELAPGFSGGISIAKADLIANITNDDPTLFTYEWNFDKLSNGDGTGDTASRATLASYRMNGRDQGNLADAGSTTRQVEVIARKSGGTLVLRNTTNILFDRIELVVIEPPPPVHSDSPRGGGGGGVGDDGDGDEGEARGEDEEFF